MVLSFSLFLAMIGPVLGDLDVNAVAGVATIEGEPAPAGTVIKIKDSTTGHTTTTSVDGPNIPPFQKGQGRFDTGDVPQFNTGDTVVVSFQSSAILGQASKTLGAGTTTVNINGNTDEPPSISNIPDQAGLEDVPWVLDLDPYISDPDTPKSSLRVVVNSQYVTVAGHKLTFLYMEGVHRDTVTVSVKDASSTVTRTVRVTVTPVNDPPVIGELAMVTLMEGEDVSIDISPLLEDPDDALASLSLQVQGGAFVGAWVEGLVLHISAPGSEVGIDSILLTVSDPDGLSDSTTVDIEVGANSTALMEFYQSKLDELNAQIADLTEENSILSHQTEQLLEVNSNLSLQMDQLLEEISRIEDERGDLQDRVDELESSAGSLAQELETLKATVRLNEETMATLESEKQNLTSQVQSLEKALEDTVERHEEVISQLEAREEMYISQIASFREELTMLEANLTRLESDASAQDELVANLTLEKKRLESIIDEREEEVSQLEQLAEGLRVQATDLGEQKKAVETSMSQVENELENLRERNANLMERIDGLGTMAPPQQTEGNNTPNQTSFDRPSTGLLASVLRVAAGGLTILSRGMTSRLAIVVIAVIAIASTVSIAARTSWIGMGSQFGGHPRVGEYWRTIESRTLTGSLGVLGEPFKRLGIPSAKTKARTGSGSKPSTSAKEPHTRAKATRRRGTKRVSKGVSIPSTGPSVAEEMVKPVTPPETVSTVSRDLPRPVVKEGTPTGEVKVRPAEAGAPEKMKEKLDYSRLSEVDREYMKALVELGFTDEAKKELRERSSQKA